MRLRHNGMCPPPTHTHTHTRVDTSYMVSGHKLLRLISLKFLLLHEILAFRYEQLILYTICILYISIVLLTIQVFWDVTVSRLASSYRRFGRQLPRSLFRRLGAKDEYTTIRILVLGWLQKNKMDCTLKEGAVIWRNIPENAYRYGRNVRELCDRVADFRDENWSRKFRNTKQKCSPVTNRIQPQRVR